MTSPKAELSVSAVTQEIKEFRHQDTYKFLMSKLI